MAAKLGEVFELVDLGPVEYLLGIEVIIRENAVLLSQRQYGEDRLKRFHMLECNGAAPPKAMTETKVKYLVSGSRPDIAHVVRGLGEAMAHYDETDYQRGKRVLRLRYLRATTDYVLWLPVTKQDPVHLEVYTDANYADDCTDRRSISGYATLFNTSVISYGSRKQSLNAQSTRESEYLAMNEGVRDVIWLCEL
ncbi:TPA: hypothetical protein N0F65_004666 [Lagenidium giganteum]|uniref:Reverse transcriptase Ty1/copia-type domain-containing protein n=1 Tax=Lagenidium giganteum TaxID=4803 RepID=A0AAV2ZDM4_9STRA|nr:TPA: hypothetical protein N0F65_004666 [Lagenidium giganteum]